MKVISEGEMLILHCTAIDVGAIIASVAVVMQDPECSLDLRTEAWRLFNELGGNRFAIAKEIVEMTAREKGTPDEQRR